MRAKHSVPLAVGMGILAGSSVLCIRAGLATPEELRGIAALPHHGAASHEAPAGAGSRSIPAGGAAPIAPDHSRILVRSVDAGLPAVNALDGP